MGASSSSFCESFLWLKFFWHESCCRQLTGIIRLEALGSP